MGVIFRPMNPLPLVKYGLSESDLAAQNDLAWRNGTILGSIDAYGSASDARFIARICPQVVELGPPNASIHQIDEHVCIDDIEPLKNIYRRVLENLSPGELA